MNIFSNRAIIEVTGFPAPLLCSGWSTISRQ